MSKENEDEKQFFKDLGATTEQTVQELRGLEENYYTLVQGTMIGIPWAADFNKKVQGYFEQNFDTAFAFARELSEARDLQDVFRIYGDYNQKYFRSIAAQVRDFVEMYTTTASAEIRGLSRHLNTNAS